MAWSQAPYPAEACPGALLLLRKQRPALLKRNVLSNKILTQRTYKHSFLPYLLLLAFSRITTTMFLNTVS
jgi:hypothetical protein